MATVLTLEDYAHLLGRFHSFLAPLEPLLMRRTELNEFGLEMETRAKAPALEMDLKQLGVTNMPPAVTDLPEVNNAAQAIGCLYVLEGSTLGGQLMAKHFRRMAGVGEAVRYFAGYGPLTGRRWKNFTEILAGRYDGASVEIRREVTKSAEACFRAMGRALGAATVGAEKRSTLPKSPSI